MEFLVGKMTEQQVRLIVMQVLAPLMKTDRFTFEKLIQVLDGRDIQLGRGTGTMLGTAADQKLGLWGTTPVDQPSAIADVSVSGSDADGTARAKINSVIAALREVGIIDT